MRRSFVAGIVLGMLSLTLLIVSGVLTRAATEPPRQEGSTPTTTLQPASIVEDSDLAVLHAKDLLFPVEGWDRAKLIDTFSEARGSRPHEALDILSPRGSRVLAVDDGVVKRLFTSVRGGITIYQFDPSESYCYYYAHLDHYADGLAEGATVHKGDLIGYVGTTGNAPPGTPHLHFTIFKLGPEKRWWEGTAVNPFTLYKGQ